MSGQRDSDLHAATLRAMDGDAWHTAAELARQIGMRHKNYMSHVLGGCYAHGWVERREIVPGSRRWEWRRTVSE